MRFLSPTETQTNVFPPSLRSTRPRRLIETCADESHNARQ